MAADAVHLVLGSRIWCLRRRSCWPWPGRFHSGTNGWDPVDSQCGKPPTRKFTRGDRIDDVRSGHPRGDSVATVGKSGSGKSTLMHMLALPDTPKSIRKS